MYYKDLEVWKEAIKLVTYVYQITDNYPKSEQFGIISQIRRCVVSIPSNISEGVVKHSDKETLRFLDIALGSLAELDTQMIISQNLSYIQSYESVDIQISKVNALLNGLINYYNKQLKDNTALVP
jgi:four helix bundle protein